MMTVTRFTEAQGMIVGIAQHRIGNHNDVMGWVGDARCFALANFQNLMFNRPRGGCFINAGNAFLVKITEQRGQHRKSTRRIRRQPHPHGVNSLKRNMEVPPKMNEGDIEES